MKVHSNDMDDEFVTDLINLLHDADDALVETESRIGQDSSDNHARRSLRRARSAVTAALKRIDSNFEFEDENEDEND